MWSIDADNIDVSNIAPSSLLTLSNAINNQSTDTIWRKTLISIDILSTCYFAAKEGSHLDFQLIVTNP